MSLSSYIKRQSRVIRRSTVGLSSILEEPSSVPENSSTKSTEKKAKKNSMKAKRRLGVSDLSIPHTSPLFTAVQGLDDADWRLRLPAALLEDTTEEDATFDFPRPPLPIFESPNSYESESSGSESGEGSRSGSESPMSSGMPTTPTPSPTTETYVATELQAQCVIRCKSIKPLTITKRSVSPIPPVPSSSTAPSSSEDNEVWQDDDEYYAAHASGFITLAPPLPPSFPCSSALPATPATSTARAARRESAIIPASTAAPLRPSQQLDPAYTSHRASVRLSRAISIPTRAPPPPPIITSGSHSRSGSSIAKQHLTPEAHSRPPPRTPIPMDALSTPWSGDYTAYAPLFTPSVTSSSSSSAASGSSSSSERLAALLSPPVHRFPAETQGVPYDVAEEDGDDDWEECTYEYDEVPLSPLVASAPSPDSGNLSPFADDLETEERAEGEKWMFPPSPLPAPAPYTGWHPRPRASQLKLAVEPLLTAARSPSPSHSPSLCVTSTSPPHQERAPAPQTPVLRSRWSSSTLSSMHSAHARSPASPKTFSFARRYFPKAKSPSPSKSAAYPRAHPKPMGTATVVNPKKRKGGKRLTVDDVLIIGRPPAPTSVPPLSLGAAAPVTPATPYSASAQWAAYPASPAPCAMDANTPSPALYAAYTTQRGPRRRASTASSRSAWSYSSSSPSASGGSDSGHSDTSTGSGLRRKPIPVEMFLR
ncbi:hypothetical protein B0H13DRAFT_2016199 [Mycena leptocephala]|nr:hypothetical protein B0H13DRAFT_2016199 [Mycena leptocephala]